jgi:hypothetical protein
MSSRSLVKKRNGLKIIYKKGPAVKQDLFSFTGTLLGHLPFTNADISIYIIPVWVI